MKPGFKKKTDLTLTGFYSIAGQVAWPKMHERDKKAERVELVHG